MVISTSILIFNCSDSSRIGATLKVAFIDSALLMCRLLIERRVRSCCLCGLTLQEYISEVVPLSHMYKFI